MKTELSDILYSVIQDIDVLMTITDYSYTGSTHTVEVCDVKWLQVGRTVTIGGNDYEVTAINYATNVLTLSGADVITTFTFNIYRPVFFYGTPREAGNDIKAISSSDDKYPMFYLLLNYEETNYEDDEDPIERTANFRLFALTDSDHGNWLTSDIHTRCIKPMTKMYSAFIETLKADKMSFDSNGFRFSTIPAYKFGVYVTNSGAEKNFFVDNLSGWEMRISELKIRKDHTCVDTCPVYVAPTEFDTSFDTSFA